MTEAFHYTLEQVSHELDFPSGVIRQLARQFEIPRNYYHPVAGQAPLMLFDAAEVAVLGQIQDLLASGYSMEEAKSWFQEASPSPTEYPEISAPLNALEEYESSESLNKHLADNTFAHYRKQTQPSPATLPIILQRLEEKRQRSLKDQARGEETNTVKSFFLKSRLFFSRLIPAIPVSTPKETFLMNTDTPWMTESLKQRAGRLQMELLAQKTVQSH